MCPRRSSTPKRVASPSTSPPLAQESALFLSCQKPSCNSSADPHRWIISIFFCRCPEGSTSYAFSPKGLTFPKALWYRVPWRYDRWETSLLCVSTLSAQHTPCKDSFIHNFLPLLSGFGLVWFWNLQSVSCLSLGVLGLQTCTTKPVSGFIV